MTRFFLASIFLVTVVLSIASQDRGYTRAKEWERDMAEFADIDRRQTPPKDPVVFAGSSTIRLWVGLRTDFPDHNVINRGFGGSRLDDLVYFSPQILLPYKPKTIVVYSGENDIEAKESAENALADFKALVDFRDKNLPKTRIIFISMKPSILRWSIWPEMKRGNDLIREEASRRKNVRFADISEKMLGPNGSKPATDLFVADGLHLSRKGYDVLRAAVLPHLK